ncbi:beta-1,3-galactosyltransferase 1-like [Diadema antillarum]|uniref:beta-1,3-galactosyltransferase 1-like n=1 Tax=Diadema antillarum TaxID=105358 RepID=UPI003A866458
MVVGWARYNPFRRKFCRLILLVVIILNFGIAILFPKKVFSDGMARKLVADQDIPRSTSVVDERNSTVGGAPSIAPNLTVHAMTTAKYTSSGDAVTEGTKHVNPHDFKYVYNEPDRCEKGENASDAFLLVLVLSSPDHFKQRTAIRDTWGGVANVDGHDVRVLFLLGQNSPANGTLESLVRAESEQFHDIIQEDFIDSYENLTLKTIAVMKWTMTFCPKVAYVMKADDDVFLHIYNLVWFLSNQTASTLNNYILCARFAGVKPIRDPKNKWYMPESQFPGGVYPVYCSGPGYVMSSDLPAVIYETSLDTPVIRLEDAYVGVCLKGRGVSVMNHEGFYFFTQPYSFCNRRSTMILWHNTGPDQMRKYWGSLFTETCEN